MALITKDDIKLRLDQLDDSQDSLLEDICAETESIIALYLGFSFDGYEDDTVKTVRGSGVEYLEMPPHEFGTITSFVSEGSTTEITGWTEDTDGRLYWAGYPYYSSWPLGTRYTVTANFGYGDWPLSVKKVAVEMAVNAFKERDKGHFSDIVGVEGAGGDVAVGYKGALLKHHKMILDRVVQNYMGVTI